VQDGRFALHDLVASAYNTVYLDTRAPLFSDDAVRLALWRGINPQSLIDDAAGGRGEPSDTGIPHRSWAYSPVEVPSFDPGAAASALEAAGWSRGRDGVRRKGDTRFAFTLSTTNDPQRVAVAENLARQWRAIGAEVEVEPLAASTFIDEHLLPRKFQAALVAVDPGPDPDPYPFWHSSQIAMPGRNLANYSDPSMDDVLERARTTDTARRIGLTLFEDTSSRRCHSAVVRASLRTCRTRVPGRRLAAVHAGVALREHARGTHQPRVEQRAPRATSVASMRSHSAADGGGDGFDCVLYFRAPAGGESAGEGRGGVREAGGRVGVDCV
jgi:hypothetical protein